MAGYTPRFLLSLSIPSVLGFLGVLWFLGRRSSGSKSDQKRITRAVQVQEDIPLDISDPMKLKEGETRCGNVDAAAQGSNDPKKAKKAKSGKAGCGNPAVCPRDNRRLDDDVALATNGIEVITLSQDASTARDQIHLRAVNGKAMEAAPAGGRNCDAADPQSVADEDVGRASQSTPEVAESVGSVSSLDSGLSAKEKCDTAEEKVQTSASEPLTLPVDCPVTGSDMLESPGAKYCDSVGSNDSGKGGSECQFLLEAQPILMVYEFEILQELCGLLIGRSGRHVRYIKEETNANILIKRHPCFPNKKICSITGTEDEIHAALKLIRKRFPVEIYPTVTLSQINSLPFELQLPETLKLCLPEGVSFEAMLCATVNAGHFFLQQPTHPTFHSLPALTTQMTALYSQLETPKLSHLSAGYVCAASLTDGWYRAEIDEVFEDTEECRLKFLDYGGYAIVPRQNLRQIRYDFMNVPFQATECYLGSVTFLEGETDWSPEATAAFEELAQGQIVQGYIVGYAENRVPYVHMYKITGATSIFINRELVSRGLARWITAPY